ncbi:MAG: flippase-like domain-containing protein [Polyangiaceae bacterium]|nr:flippase-like domain-containing protein [Polyangiaceae bacterium]
MRLSPEWQQRVGRWLLRGGSTAVILGLVLWQVPPASVVATLFDLDWEWLGLAVCLTLAINLLKPLRWLWLLQAVKPSTTYRQALGSLLVAATARLVVPGKFGEYGRIYPLRGLSLKSGLGLTTVDILIEMENGVLFALPAAFCLGGVVATVPPLLALLAVAAVTRWPDLLLRGVARLVGSSRLREQAAAAHQVMGMLSRNTWNKSIGLTVVLNLLRFLQLGVLILALDQNLTVLAWLCLPVIQLADAIPLTVAGIGVREWVGLKVLPWAAIPDTVAVTSVLLQSVISGFAPGAAGLFFFHRAGEQSHGSPEPTEVVS